MARNRCQSVLETFEEVCFFMSCRLSKRDNADFFWCFGIDDNGNGYAFEKPQRHEALFAVAESYVTVDPSKTSGASRKSTL
jgi:hypothetical protein